MPTVSAENRVQGNDVLFQIEDPQNEGTYLDVGVQRGLDRSDARTRINLSGKGDDVAVEDAGRRTADISFEALAIVAGGDAGFDILRENYTDNTQFNFRIIESENPVQEGSGKVLEMNRTDPDDSESTFSVTIITRSLQDVTS